MCDQSKRCTIYFEPVIHAALSLKSAHSQRSVSEIVNEAVRVALDEEHQDLAAFETRRGEPTISLGVLLNELEVSGKI